MNSGPFSGAVGLYDGFYGGFGGGHGHGHEHGFGQQLGASTSSVLRDGGTGELGAAAAAEVPKRKGGGREEKAATALRSHSEAERRRRERINAHLATLRSMVPCTDKMDKAALLAEVINHVKKLKSEAARVGRHCPVPSGADEVTVVVVQQPQASPQHSRAGAAFLVKATLSCGDACADLFADVRRAGRRLGGHHAGRPRPDHRGHVARGRRDGGLGPPGARLGARQGRQRRRRLRVLAEGLAPGQQTPEGLDVRLLELFFLT